MNGKDSLIKNQFGFVYLGIRFVFGLSGKKPKCKSEDQIKLSPVWCRHYGGYEWMNFQGCLIKSMKVFLVSFWSFGLLPCMLLLSDRFDVLSGYSYCMPSPDDFFSFQ